MPRTQQIRERLGLGCKTISPASVSHGRHYPLFLRTQGYLLSYHFTITVLLYEILTQVLVVIDISSEKPMHAPL